MKGRLLESWTDTESSFTLELIAAFCPEGVDSQLREHARLPPSSHCSVKLRLALRSSDCPSRAAHLQMAHLLRDESQPVPESRKNSSRPIPGNYPYCFLEPHCTHPILQVGLGLVWTKICVTRCSCSCYGSTCREKVCCLSLERSVGRSLACRSNSRIWCQSLSRRVCPTISIEKFSMGWWLTSIKPKEKNSMLCLGFWQPEHWSQGA